MRNITLKLSPGFQDHEANLARLLLAKFPEYDWRINYFSGSLVLFSTFRLELPADVDKKSDALVDAITQYVEHILGYFKNPLHVMERKVS